MPQPTTAQHPEFAQFLELSAQLGQNIERTQGAGGNTSIKNGGTMWVKASGTWLAHALERDIMVPVEIAPLVDALRAGDVRAEKATDFVVADLNLSGLRPSIETSFHAILPQTVVAHFHCVNTLALAVVERRQELIAERMQKFAPDLGYRFIPYRRPGTPLATAIDEVAHEAPDVLFLFNHGVIVTGDTVGQVRQRIEAVTNALAMPRAAASGPPDIAVLQQIASGTAFRLPVDVTIHDTALNARATAISVEGSLYPDHIIFLGTQIGLLEPGQTIRELIGQFERNGQPIPKMLIVPGKGVLLSDTLTEGGEIMARCLAEVATRIPEGETPCYLDQQAEYELTHWEAEQYRQALDRRMGESR